jgi:hypothetical protein
MKWRLIAILASTIPIIIIAIQFDIKLEDVFAFGIIPILGAAGAMMVKLVIQGLKFSYISRKYLGSIDSITKMTGVRMGSEFVKFTTPMFVGAEFVVIYWLHKKGVSPSKASWVAILDIVTEVLAGGLLSIMAGIIALSNGAYIVAAVILGTSIFVTTLWMILFFLSSKTTFQIPISIVNIVKKFGKDQGAKYIEQTNLWMKEVCDISRNNFGTKESKKVFINGFLLSIISWVFYGLSFFIIANGTGYAIEFFDSFITTMGANAIGNLPITVGGSGLVEVGIVAYLNNLDPFNFEIPTEHSLWSSVIAWRIATYYIPIATTWILLVKMALSKFTNPNIS